MTLRSGQVAIVTIALVGLAFFGGMELLKKQLHSTPAPLSSVIVIPSKVVGPAEMDFLTDAVPASLSALLRQVQGLDTKSPPSSLEVDQAHGDLKQIADAHHVTAVLTSEITVEEDALTLNIQLLNPETHSLLWNSQYRSKRTDYNGLLRQAAEGAGRALQPGSPRVISTEGLAPTSEAELAYREGEHYLMRFNSLHQNADCDLSMAAFKRAVQLAPGLSAPSCHLP